MVLWMKFEQQILYNLGVGELSEEEVIDGSVVCWVQGVAICVNDSKEVKNDGN